MLLALLFLAWVSNARPATVTAVHAVYPRDTVLPPATHVMPISRNHRNETSRSKGLSKRQQLLERDTIHSVAITLGGQDVQLFLDTGSSNLFVVEQDYTCINDKAQVVDDSECGFTTSNFDPSTASGSKIEPSFFNTGYADGSYVIGYGWESDATLNGLSLRAQQFGVAKTARWFGGAGTSGLFGLGSLFTNQVYRNNSVSPQPGDDNRVVFPNPFTLAWQQGASEYHTLALNRVPFDQQKPNTDSPAGYLTIGGVPSDISVTGKQITVPVIKWTVGANGAQINEQALSAPDILSTFTFPGSDTITQTPKYASMDTGAPRVSLPTDVFNAWNAQVQSTNCDGSGLPELAWHVDGLDFPYDKRDLLSSDGQGGCVLNVVDGGDDVGLGPNFAQNAVFTWNKATGEVTIMERTPY